MVRVVVEHYPIHSKDLNKYLDNPLRNNSRAQVIHRLRALEYLEPAEKEDNNVDWKPLMPTDRAFKRVRNVNE